MSHQHHRSRGVPIPERTGKIGTVTELRPAKIVDPGQIQPVQLHPLVA